METRALLFKYIDRYETEELDFELKDEFGLGAYDEENDVQEIIHDDINAKHYTDGLPINIDILIGKLQEFKNKGATHVEMDWHCDHLAYLFSAVNIREATAKEIEDEIKLRQTMLNKQLEDKKKKLECELDKVKLQLNK